MSAVEGETAVKALLPCVPPRRWRMASLSSLALLGTLGLGAHRSRAESTGESASITVVNETKGDATLTCTLSKSPPYWLSCHLENNDAASVVVSQGSIAVTCGDGSKRLVPFDDTYVKGEGVVLKGGGKDYATTYQYVCDEVKGPKGRVVPQVQPSWSSTTRTTPASTGWEVRAGQNAPNGGSQVTLEVKLTYEKHYRGFEPRLDVRVHNLTDGPRTIGYVLHWYCSPIDMSGDHDHAQPEVKHEVEAYGYGPEERIYQNACKLNERITQVIADNIWSKGKDTPKPAAVAGDNAPGAGEGTAKANGGASPSGDGATSAKGKGGSSTSPSGGASGGAGASSRAGGADAAGGAGRSSGGSSRGSGTASVGVSGRAPGEVRIVPRIDAKLPSAAVNVAAAAGLIGFFVAIVKSGDGNLAKGPSLHFHASLGLAAGGAQIGDAYGGGGGMFTELALWPIYSRYFSLGARGRMTGVGFYDESSSPYLAELGYGVRALLGLEGDLALVGGYDVQSRWASSSSADLKVALTRRSIGAHLCLSRQPKGDTDMCDDYLRLGAHFERWNDVPDATVVRYFGELTFRRSIVFEVEVAPKDLTGFATPDVSSGRGWRYLTGASGMLTLGVSWDLFAPYHDVTAQPPARETEPTEAEPAPPTPSATPVSPAIQEDDEPEAEEKGTLAIDADPTATCTIDGGAPLTTPIVRLVPTGSHEIVCVPLAMAGAKEQRRTAVVRRGKRTSVTIELEE